MHLTAERGNAQQQRITTTKQAKAGVQMRERSNARAGKGTSLPAVARALAVPAGCVQASSAGGLSLAEQTGSFWPTRSCRADFASPHSTKSNTPPCRAMHASKIIIDLGETPVGICNSFEPQWDSFDFLHGCPMKNQATGLSRNISEKQ